ncbi:unnamed protein product, partial [marine sediment metagenome]
SLLSGRGDLNPGPHGPEPCALSGLRYAPKASRIIAQKPAIDKSGQLWYTLSNLKINDADQDE